MRSVIKPLFRDHGLWKLAFLILAVLSLGACSNLNIESENYQKHLEEKKVVAKASNPEGFSEVRDTAGKEQSQYDHMRYLEKVKSEKSFPNALPRW